MNIKKTIKNAMLLTLLLAPLSSFALFDFGRDRYYDDYYYDRPRVFGGYRRGYYADRRYQDLREMDQRELDLKKKELDLIEKEAQIRAEKQKPVNKK